MSCFFEAVLSEGARSELLAAWVISGKAAGAKALFAWNQDRYVQVYREDAFPEEYGQEIQKLARGRTGMIGSPDAGIFLEPVLRERKLVICGAGHVSLALVRLGSMLDYTVTVIEDREAFAARAKEAGAQFVICRPFEEALNALGSDPGTAFVIMTREHAYDVHCLRCILRKPYAYAGMMGSRGRTGQIRQQMLEEGFDAGKVEGLYMPIGLPIGSRTPQEIAVSVMAQIIKVMNESEAGEGYPPGLLRELAARSAGEGLYGILVMVVEKRGEGPRKPGTKMLVREDGSCLGTVGGGYVEAQAINSAQRMLREGCRDCRLISVDMKKGAMFCGGETTLFLLPLQKGGREG